MSNHLVIGARVNCQDGCATACHLRVSLWPQTVVLYYQYCLTAGLFIHQHAPFSIRSKKRQCETSASCRSSLFDDMLRVISAGFFN